MLNCSQLLKVGYASVPERRAGSGVANVTNHRLSKKFAGQFVKSNGQRSSATLNNHHIVQHERSCRKPPGWLYSSKINDIFPPEQLPVFELPANKVTTSAKCSFWSFIAASSTFKPASFFSRTMAVRLSARSFSYSHPNGTTLALTISFKVFASISSTVLYVCIQI